MPNLLNAMKFITYIVMFIFVWSTSMVYADSSQVVPLSSASPISYDSQQTIANPFQSSTKSGPANYVGEPPPPITGTTSTASSFETASGVLTSCTSSTNPIINCPGLNGVLQYPTKGANCPAACVVDRFVQTSTSGSVTTIVQVTNPVCPVGYVQQEAFNMQPEIAYLTAGQPVPSPFDMATYTSYINSNYTCQYDTTNTNTVSGCGTDPNYSVYPTVVPINGYAAAYFNHKNSQKDSNTCYIFSNICSLPFCTLYPPGTSYCSTPGPSCTPSIFPFNPAFVRYSYSWAYMTCTPPAGFYYTSNYIPASVLCTRVQPTWISPYGSTPGNPPKLN